MPIALISRENILDSLFELCYNYESDRKCTRHRVFINEQLGEHEG